MKKTKLCISLILINIAFIIAVKKDICKKCVKIEDCPTVALMTIHEQQMWLEQQVPCENLQSNEKPKISGFSSIAKGDYVCCPNSKSDNETNERRPITDSINILNNEDPHNNENGSNTLSIPGPYYPNQKNQLRPKTPSNQNQNINPYLRQKRHSHRRKQNNYANYENSNFFDTPNSESKCEAQTRFPPNPKTGCCGQDMSYSSTIVDWKKIIGTFTLPSNSSSNKPQDNNRNRPRKRRHAKNITMDTNIGDRITGGTDTQLDQFPWTVFLNIIFNKGDQQLPFNCGGSLISPKYVLTAAHCVYISDDSDIEDIKIILAEYDKRTFPIDCITSGLDGDKKCVNNILMHAEEVNIHPRYDKDRLYNDIALIELDGYAPYTQYIRSICLPFINIDDPERSNLHLEAAGWGHDGQYYTDVKKSTVVQLVPHDQCEASYRRLSNTQLCAAGRTGEDTCKGDSGGPLMLNYKDNYYVVGVVSGKRADTPCGSTVPTLYTNIYYYVPWIESVINS